MFELWKLLPMMVAADLGINAAKEAGLMPISMLTMSNFALDYKKEREYENWRTAITNPNSKFFVTQDVTDGKKTVGWGLTESLNHVYPSDCKITHFGQKFTFDQIQRMYNAGLDHFKNLTQVHLENRTLPQRMYDGIISVVWNTGDQLFWNNNQKRPTKFKTKLMEGDWEGAIKECDFWKSGGVVSKGVVARRMGEHAIMLGKTPKSHKYYLTVWQQYVNTRDFNLL